MRIATIGRGNMGGGLASLWERAGHEVTRLGSDGGDVTGAEVLLIAVPGHLIQDALQRFTGFAGQVTLDATSIRADRAAERNEAYPSLAHHIQSMIGGPTAKAFGNVYASLFDRVQEQRVRPSNVFAADDAARAIVEKLIEDAGFDPVFLGPLDPGARLIENSAPLIRAIAGTVGPHFYRFAPPGSL
jgi:predicted dinucleotide-binding enzyme